jgi:hypothetical protein
VLRRDQLQLPFDFVSIVTGAGLHDTDRNLIYQIKPINSDKQTEIPEVMHRTRLRGG